MSDHGGLKPTIDTRTLAAKHLRDRGMEWAESINKAGPLQLLELPLDVLQTIIKGIVHTNDLTSLALTHSVLHRLVVPHIYSRFDIVWPDTSPTVESRVGVDALTYGLATLVMAQDVFGESQMISTMCIMCGSSNFCQHRDVPIRARKTRRGNNFAQHTRKFSLGNGPEDWVKEYLITKEGGKMLGTLVASAVGRMRNLESFTWDMPTGVLRDVWLALASLDGRDDGQDCRLERVWVRWHDNQDTLMTPPVTGPLTGPTSLPHLVSGAEGIYFQVPPYPRVVFPTFSVLPPLKSLNVLDIDEVSYFEEMSVLIERSLNGLQELRVGLARHAQNRAWARPRENRGVVPPSLAQSGGQASRPGGILGILVSRFCSPFDETAAATGQSSSAVAAPQIIRTQQAIGKHSAESKTGSDRLHDIQDDMHQLGDLLSTQTLSATTPLNVGVGSLGEEQLLLTFHETARDDQRRLLLKVLELERMHLSLQVLSKAVDWSCLRTLTILGCRDHEHLWKALRKEFAPSSPSSRLSTSLLPPISGVTSSISSSLTSAEYPLSITRLHTDGVSALFLAFIKDTLAPDSLEYLFLQQSPSYKTSVTVDQIYKHAVRRHRGSLKKLLIDSDIRAADGAPDGNKNWKKWAVSRELITCITSGRMHLRELSVSIDYKDWHYFLQRLPNASDLRSLHIQHIADYVNVRMDAREAALQVLDIVALRPELELCYLGIQEKCFEILEYLSDRQSPAMSDNVTGVTPSSHLVDDDDDDDDDDAGDEHGHEDHSGNDSDDLNLVTDQEDADESEGEAGGEKQKAALRLREILFYDDKISIFKARHGRL